MPSPAFAALALQASVAADALLAETWTLLPRKPGRSVNDPGAPDPGRWSGPIQATFVNPQAEPEMPNSYDRRQARRPGTESGHARLLVSPAALAAMAAAASVAGLPAAIRQDDQLVRQDGGVAWRIGSAFPMAGGTLQVSINILG